MVDAATTDFSDVAVQSATTVVVGKVRLRADFALSYCPATPRRSIAHRRPPSGRARVWSSVFVGWRRASIYRGKTHRNPQLFSWRASTRTEDQSRRLRL
jgi:hypothetical protein